MGATTIRVGGWGEVFGDEGSGYWIAVQGLNAWSRMSDGRRRRVRCSHCSGIGSSWPTNRSHRRGPQPLARTSRRHRRAGTDVRRGRGCGGRCQSGHPAPCRSRAGLAGHNRASRAGCGELRADPGVLRRRRVLVADGTSGILRRTRSRWRLRPTTATAPSGPGRRRPCSAARRTSVVCRRSGPIVSCLNITKLRPGGRQRPTTSPADWPDASRTSRPADPGEQHPERRAATPGVRLLPSSRATAPVCLRSGTAATVEAVHGRPAFGSDEHIRRWCSAGDAHEPASIAVQPAIMRHAI